MHGMWVGRGFRSQKYQQVDLENGTEHETDAACSLVRFYWGRGQAPSVLHTPTLVALSIVFFRFCVDLFMLHGVSCFVLLKGLGAWLHILVCRPLDGI